MTTAEHPVVPPPVEDDDPIPPPPVTGENRIVEGFATAAATAHAQAHEPIEGRLMATPPGGRLFTEGGPPDLQELEKWIRAHDEDMVRGSVVKANEYGTGDIEIMGSTMQAMVPGTDFLQGQLLAVLFYLEGKIARGMSAIQQGRMPSHDTFRDAEVYAKIGLKLMETGKWL